MPQAHRLRDMIDLSSLGDVFDAETEKLACRESSHDRHEGTRAQIRRIISPVASTSGSGPPASSTTACWGKNHLKSGVMSK
ncbi:hypothetical protein MCOR02_001880 [Pyricularia oryzae]|nr:hypothetical protein MCOR02_001880 [Pyricularia oryzae]KAI6259348.1 hypothetical protein MCOR19_004269 [Pyricularia oryzae]KAI6395520.1 hypothetical protein MCOR20_010222 [Pyricularia oryzae]KAI6400426.1 hypothetical protein MCOR23_004781 [Pyricularia oryzae]KAI6443808.1 hypothetical protein MCOR22_005107 [Pyricularia oryzae]